MLKKKNLYSFQTAAFTVVSSGSGQPTWANINGLLRNMKNRIWTELRIIVETITVRSLTVQWFTHQTTKNDPTKILAGHDPPAPRNGAVHRGSWAKKARNIPQLYLCVLCITMWHYYVAYYPADSAILCITMWHLDENWSFTYTMPCNRIWTLVTLSAPQRRWVSLTSSVKWVYWANFMNIVEIWIKH